MKNTHFYGNAAAAIILGMILLTAGTVRGSLIEVGPTSSITVLEGTSGTLTLTILNINCGLVTVYQPNMLSQVIIDYSGDDDWIDADYATITGVTFDAAQVDSGETIHLNISFTTPSADFGWLNDGDFGITTVHGSFNWTNGGGIQSSLFSGDIIVVDVPEPSTLSLLVIGGLAGVRVLRRRWDVVSLPE